MSNREPGWTSTLDDYTEHAERVFQDQGQRLHEDGILKTTPVDLIPDDTVREAVEAIEAGTSEDGKQLPPWFLPGFGDNPDEAPELYRPEKCGEIIPWVCDEDSCGRGVEIGDTCRMSRCPRCAASWALKAAENPMASLMHTRYVRDQASQDHIRIHHNVVSPKPGELFDVPRDALNEEVVDEALDVIQNVLEALGITDYHLVYHAWRGKDEHKVAAGEEEVGDDRGAWKGRLFQGEGSESFASLRDRELKLSPHFHLLTVANEVPGGQITKAIEAATGWVLHRITPDNSRVSLYDYKDLARALTYCISHASLYVDSNGNYRALSRSFGMVKACDPSEREREWARELLRSPDVAGVTLGINPSSLECSAPDAATVTAIRGGPLQDEPDEGEPAAVTDVVATSTQRSRVSPAARSRQNPSAGELPNGGSTWSAPGALEAGDAVDSGEESEGEPEDTYDPDDAPEDRCGGALRPIWEMTERINSEEWRERAAFAEDTLDLVEEHAAEIERLEPPDDLNPPD